MGQKVEAALLKVSANNQANGSVATSRSTALPAALDYRKPRDGDAEVRHPGHARRKRAPSSASISWLPPAARCRSSSTAASRARRRQPLAIEADLTQAKVDNLLPGWSKPSGRPGRATFTLINKPTTCRSRIWCRSVPASRSRARSRSTLRRRAVGEFPRLRPVRGRQGHAQGRSRQRRHVAGDHARRRLRRTRLRQVDDDRPGRSKQTTTRISISTSSSAPWWAITARRCAASICRSRGAPASSRAWR